MSGSKGEPTLKPQLHFFDAVATGLAAILGAGIFAVIAPAAGIAGPALLISLLIAAFVAFCNAISSAQMAAVFPRTGGTYEFGRRLLGDWWGYSAGWMFLTANTVGPGVTALAFGEYVNAIAGAVPARTAAVLAALVMTTINAVGIRRSVRITDVVVVLSVLSLLAFVVIGLPHAKIPMNLTPFAPGGAGGILNATALLFFAYTGYQPDCHFSGGSAQSQVHHSASYRSRAWNGNHTLHPRCPNCFGSDGGDCVVQDHLSTGSYNDGGGQRSGSRDHRCRSASHYFQRGAFRSSRSIASSICDEPEQ